MNATTAKLTICNRTVAIADSQLEALNAVLAQCHVYDRYSDGDKPTSKTMRIEATLTLEAKENS